MQIRSKKKNHTTEALAVRHTLHTGTDAPGVCSQSNIKTRAGTGKKGIPDDSSLQTDDAVAEWRGAEDGHSLT